MQALPHGDPSPFKCTYTPELTDLLSALNCSLMISTYQAGKVIIFSPDLQKDGLSQLPRTFNTPMGLAKDGDRLAVATKDEVVVLSLDPSLCESYPPKPGHYDGIYLPRAVYFTGQLHIHDLDWGNKGLIAVNTMFSCLCQINHDYSFVPLWKPSFVSELAPEDRCHLNGMAVENGEPLYVTMFGETNTPKGWDGNKEKGGLLMHVPSGEIILKGLPMPHSPRIIEGKLYLLLSATGELIRVDVESGKYEVVTKLPGFARGLSYYKDYLFVGMSKIRKKHMFGNLPIAQENNFSGIIVVHLPTGSIVGQIKYLNSCEEIYDVQVLPDQLRPNILGIHDNTHRRSLSTPEGGYWSAENKEI